MKSLYNLIDQNREFIFNQVIRYAKLHHYVAYTSILPETWMTAINGLAEAFLTVLNNEGTIRALDFYDDFSRETLSAFAVQEARKHRHRGVTLEMFLGLMKYFRQAFRDLVLEQQMEKEAERDSLQLIERFFDRIEMGFCLEWTGEQRDELVQSMQHANRELANEKSKYLAIFESIPSPVILLNQQHRVENMNYSAVELLMAEDSPVFAYHAEKEDKLGVEQLMPWLADEFFLFISGYDKQVTVEKEVLLKEDDRRNFMIKLHRLVDISERLKGTVIILNDLTESKQAEEALRFMSFHDGLTGLYNRAYFEQEMQRLENGRSDPLGIISFDVDGLKLVNDVLGHQAGDRLLVAAASVIRSCFRENDVVARIGGDEFAVLLPDSDDEVVEQAAQRMRGAVENYNQENLLLPLSISQGWAVRTDCSKSLSRVYQEADYQMYLEKPWNREVFHQHFKELYQRFNKDLYKVDLGPRE